MKAYVLESIGKLEYKDIEKPVLKQGEVLVEVKAAGICGSDIPRIYQTGTYHFPTIPGHEFSGKVVETYDVEDAEWIGKRVGIFPLIPCQKCDMCGEEAFEMCRNYNYLGSRCDGGFAEYVAVPIWNLIELPEQISYEEAAMLEPAAVALHGVRKLKLDSNTTVSLLGLGTIGSIVVQWLSYYGILKVYASGHKKEFGEVMKNCASKEYQYCNTHEWNVVEWISKETEHAGADIVIDCIGTGQSLIDSIESVRAGGQILIVGNPKNDVQIPQKVYWQILRKQITIGGTWNSSFWHRDDDDWHMVLDACKEGKLNLSALISHRHNFEELYKGLEIMRQKEEYRNKVMIFR